MKIRVSNNTKDIIMSGLDCVVFIPINVCDNVREVIDILITTYGQNETKIIGVIKDVTNFVGFKFQSNVNNRIDVLRKLLTNDSRFNTNEDKNENCIIFKISRK